MCGQGFGDIFGRLCIDKLDLGAGERLSCLRGRGRRFRGRGALVCAFCDCMRVLNLHHTYKGWYGRGRVRVRRKEEMFLGTSRDSRPFQVVPYFKLIRLKENHRGISITILLDDWLNRPFSTPVSYLF